jgi:hypothetical protein
MRFELSSSAANVFDHCTVATAMGGSEKPELLHSMYVVDSGLTQPTMGERLDAGGLELLRSFDSLLFMASDAHLEASVR